MGKGLIVTQILPDEHSNTLFPISSSFAFGIINVLIASKSKCYSKSQEEIKGFVSIPPSLLSVTLASHCFVCSVDVMRTIL